MAVFLCPLLSPAPTLLERAFPPGTYLAVNCDILDRYGHRVRVYPFRWCHFFEDGHILVGQINYLAMLDPRGKVIWSKNDPRHHRFTLRLDGKSFYQFVSHDIVYEGRLIRADEIQVLGLDGQILLRQDLSVFHEEIRRHFGLNKMPMSFNDWFPTSRAKWEVTHANIAVEIPDNILKNFNPAFERGNVLINLYLPFGAQIVLSSDLKKLLWISPRARHLHQVDFVGPDRLMAYMNRSDIQMTKENFESDLQEINPLTNEVLWSLRRLNPRLSFRSWNMGSWQILGDHLLYSDQTHGARVYLIDRQTGGFLWSYQYGDVGDKRTTISQAEILNLESFLRNSTY